MERKRILIVFGIPSLDIPHRKWRRRRQRVTCWQFPEVAARHNNFTGALLPLYLLARHPMHSHTLSAELAREADLWQDIIIYPMNEVLQSTEKRVSDNGYWSYETKIGSSCKTFFWFQFAVHQFPQVLYVGKGNDDTFLSVPQYLANLRLLPRKRIYWGRPLHKGTVLNSTRKRVNVTYMLGYCYTLARDAAEAFVSYKPMKKLVLLPYNKTTEPEFISMNMPYENVMVGKILKEINFSSIYVLEGSIRFHAYTSNAVTNNFVATRKPKEHKYYLLVNNVMFCNKSQKNTIILNKTADLYDLRNFT